KLDLAEQGFDLAGLVHVPMGADFPVGADEPIPLFLQSPLQLQKALAWSRFSSIPLFFINVSASAKVSGVEFSW
ncbi:MAG: hypothetical protein ACLFQQ_21200, partial [Desulfococcaceae bacterium]